MGQTLEASVLIPSRGRAAKVAACVAALARQTVAGEFEVLVGFDGEDPDGAAALGGARGVWEDGGGQPGLLTTRELPRQGQAGVRNELLGLARGRTLVFFNDDMRPEPACVEAHLRAQRECDALGRRALVVGASPWVIHEPDRLFDRLVRETSMVFFYDRMTADDAWRDWGFRHAWLLNLSAPRQAVERAGGFTRFPSTYGYEDDELAHRLAERDGFAVCFRPGAVALHDHRMGADAYLEREYKLGFAALGFAGVAPECARAMFGRDVTGGEETAYARRFVAEEARGAARLLESFRGLERVPADAVGGAHARTLVNLLYEQHLPLKRFAWRAGIADAASGGAMAPARLFELLGSGQPRAGTTIEAGLASTSLKGAGVV